MVVRPRERIKRDQVYFRRDPVQPPHQIPRQTRRVVDTLQHHVLERYLFVRISTRVTLARIHQAIQRMYFIQRHKFVTEFVVRGVERNGQAHRADFAQPVDPDGACLTASGFDRLPRPWR